MAGRDYLGLLLLGIGIFLIPFLIRNDYYLGVLVFAAFNVISCTGLCLLIGYAGQISLGHAAFIAVGAYASAILTTRFGWSPWSAMLAGVFLNALLALLVGTPSLRLKGHYLAMATLGFGAIVHIVAVAAVGLTGGPEGIGDIPGLSLAGVSLASDTANFYFGWAIAFIGLYLAVNLIHSRVGRGLRSLHGSEAAAGAAGVDTARYKIKIFVFSAVYASISGSLYAGYVRYIDPVPFGIMHSVLLVTMVAVGGIHTIMGAVSGAVLLTLLPEILSFVSDYFQFIGLDYSSDYDTLVYGGILLGIMLFWPEGILEGAIAGIGWLKRRLGGKGRGADGKK